MVRLKLDSGKAIEAVAVLAGQSPGKKIGRKRLLALLYIANRECLRKSGRPLLGGKLVAMKHGPVHSRVLDLINGKEIEGTAEWAKHFHNEDHDVVLDVDPGVNALSRFEARVLTETLKKYEDEQEFVVARLTHKFKEYVMNYEKGKGRVISLEQLIYAVGGLTPMANSILRDIKEKQEIDEMFASVEDETGENK